VHNAAGNYSHSVIKTLCFDVWLIVPSLNYTVCYNYVTSSLALLCCLIRPVGYRMSNILLFWAFFAHIGWPNGKFIEMQSNGFDAVFIKWQKVVVWFFSEIKDGCAYLDGATSFWFHGHCPCHILKWCTVQHAILSMLLNFNSLLCVSAIDTEFSGLSLSAEHCGRWVSSFWRWRSSPAFYLHSSKAVSGAVQHAAAQGFLMCTCTQCVQF